LFEMTICDPAGDWRSTQPLENDVMTSLRNALLIGIMLIMPAAAMAEDAHHPTTEAPAPIGNVQPGMMGPGMMSPEMMGMMKSMSQMMDPTHIEGRIAFLQTELKITDAQQPLWNAYADAMRKATHSQKEMMEKMQLGMMSSNSAVPDDLLQQIDRYEQMLSARLDQLRQTKAALAPLYDALDDAQKRTADELLAPHGMGSM
jgi:hypothetical protein